jgi:serine/threonine protein kinase
MQIGNNDEINTKYAPTNQLKKDGYGKATDIWSFGISLVEMATAKPPFVSAAAAIYAVCVRKEYPKFPSTMSNEANDFLSKCLVEDPKFRATTSELLNHPFLAISVSLISYISI